MCNANAGPQLRAWLVSQNIQINRRSSPPGEPETAKRPAPFPISEASFRDVKRVRVDLIEELPSADDSEEMSFLSPGRDPKTLCPYCDRPLPETPSSIFANLLQKPFLRSVSVPECRPSNPLGLKAPLGAFLHVCERHVLESLLLPQAETNGWPTSIDWEQVKARAEKISPLLRPIIFDAGDSRETNAFWLAALKDKSNGSVADQIASFQNYQPGYYGGQGSLIIYQVLEDKFEAVRNRRIFTGRLSQWDFTSKVLTPEVALHLIMEDFQCGRDQAEEIRIKSCAYGAAMFIAND